MIDAITQFLSLYGAIAIFSLMLCNGLVSAPPSELVLCSSGVMASIGLISIYEVIGYAVAGNLLGALMLYALGTKINHDWIAKAKSQLVSSDLTILRRVSKIVPDHNAIIIFQHQFRNEGGVWLFVFRFMPIVRSIISLPAGMVRFDLTKFVVYSTAGILVWVLAWVLLGFYLSNTWVNYKYAISLPILTIVIILLCFGHKKVNKMYKI